MKEKIYLAPEAEQKTANKKSGHKVVAGLAIATALGGVGFGAHEAYSAHNEAVIANNEAMINDAMEHPEDKVADIMGVSIDQNSIRQIDLDGSTENTLLLEASADSTWDASSLNSIPGFGGDSVKVSDEYHVLAYPDVRVVSKIDGQSDSELPVMNQIIYQEPVDSNNSMNESNKDMGDHQVVERVDYVEYGNAGTSKGDKVYVQVPSEDGDYTVRVGTKAHLTMVAHHNTDHEKDYGKNSNYVFTPKAEIDVHVENGKVTVDEVRNLSEK